MSAIPPANPQLLAQLAQCASLDRIARALPKKIYMSLDRMQRLLNALDNPQDKLPPVVHIAGTKGKGSTVAMLRACIEAAGHRAHVYTSPHLVHFRERIRLNGQLIEEEELLVVLDECWQANRRLPIAFFEIVTAAAFVALARVPADIALVEVGVGGRFDATNVVRRPALTAITPVSLDHQQFLGDTITEIAGHKAGIIKPGVPVVVAPQTPIAAAVIEECAAVAGAPLYRAGQEWSCDAFGDGIRYTGSRWRLDLPRPSLFGAHQIVNAGVALACLEQLAGFPFNGAALAAGLRDIDWPGRLQLLRRGPLVAILPAEWELWLDGGHNPAAGNALGAVAAAWRDKPLYLIVGMLADKDPAGFLAPLAPYVDRLSAITIPDDANSLPAAAISAPARSVGIAARESDSIEAALRHLIATETPGRVLICGSLHLAGSVLGENG
jgi:dihydrofolate synthase / folylpolyglutamate synthase